MFHALDIQNVEVVAQDGPVSDFNRSRLSRIKEVPFVTILLIVSQVGFFISNCVYNRHGLKVCISPHEEDVGFADYFYHWMWWSRGCISHDKRDQLWRYFSSPMSHYGALHITNNLILTMMLGLDIEWIYGHRSLLFVWLSSCMIGIWSYQAWKNVIGKGTTRLVGSSGAVYGLIGCRLSNLLLNGDSMIKMEMVFRTFFVVLFIALDIVGYYIDEGSSIAYMCHWGGAAGGVLSGLVVFKNYEETKLESITSKVLIGVLCVYSIIVCIGTYVIKLDSC